VTFNTSAEPFEIYFVLVFGATSGSGNFGLTVTCAPPVNDVCNNPSLLNCGHQGRHSTIAATGDAIPVCGSLSATDPGTWFVFTGNGNFMTISTCSQFTEIPTKMAVFTGNCASLTCVAASDGICGNQARISLPTVSGTQYRVLVQGANGAQGYFRIGLFCGLPPSNDICSSAITLSCGSVVSGNLSGAGVETPIPPDCGGPFGLDNDVWYKFVGGGGVATVSLCGSSFPYLQLSVFTGSCGNLACVAGDDNNCPNLNGEVSLPTTNGTTYFVKVSHPNDSWVPFVISLDNPPTNDNCANSILITTPQTVAGSNKCSSVESPNPPNCTTLDGTAGDVWYRFVGNGTNATVSLCNATATFDAQLSVFTGNCGSLTCIASNDDFCDNRPQVTFATTYGTVYFIRINGKNNAKGNFSLSLSFSAPANELCANATLVNCGSSTNGTTLGATAETTPNCGVPLTSSPGVWYRFVGNGGIATVSTCDLFNNNFDTKIRVYTGSCTSLACVASNDNGTHCFGLSRINFQTTSGVTYRILVNGALNQSGNFTLSVTCGAPLIDGYGTETFFDDGETTVQFQSTSPNFHLLPNPTTNSGGVNLRMPTLPEAQDVSIEIHNLFGQTVLQRSLGRVDALDVHIDLSSLANGLYLATLRVGNEKAIQRLVVATDR
jgi:hypothetical protein